MKMINFLNIMKIIGLKKQKFFNYYDLVDDIIKLKNLYISQKIQKIQKNFCFGELKGLDKLYFSINICKTVHSHISKFLPHNKVTTSNFRNKFNSIIEKYKINQNIIRRDYITRTRIILFIKLNLNDIPKIITYNLFNQELQNTISIMTNNININFMNEILK